MNIFKLTLQILFFIIFFSTLQAKNTSKFNEGSYISDYFSGILLLNNNQYDESYKFLKRLNGLEKKHINYSSKYLYSLVNLGKFEEAFKYAKKLEKRELDSFESDLIVGIYHLKNEQTNQAKKYFLKIKKRNSNFALNTFLSNSLLNWSSFDKLNISQAKKKIDEIDPQFKNLSDIENLFMHCFYESTKTESFFKKLTTNDKIDYSRFNYFYATYLLNSNKIDQAKKVIKSSLKLYPRNLLINQYKIDLNNNKNRTRFDCKKQAHVVAEILYITANALSSQSIYKFSNFYLNLAKYLNNEFYSFDALLAENFYKIGNYKKAKKIYNNMEKHGESFLWHAAKQNTKILIKENKKEKAFKLMDSAYKKLLEKNVYEKFDYTFFLKNNEKFKESIQLYTEIMKMINKDHPLFPQVVEGRGVAYERVGEWNKAEKDLLSSLDVSPDQAYVINYLAYSWIEQGVKIEKSLRMLEKANELKSNDPYIIDSLGWALFKLKRFKDSKKYLQIAVQLMPADPVVNDHFGDALWKNGNKIQARYYWNYVLNLEEAEKDLKNSIKNKLVLGL